MIDKLALLVTVIGGINWGSIGLFEFNLVEFLLGSGLLSRIIYVVVALGALWCITLLFRERSIAD